MYVLPHTGGREGMHAGSTLFLDVGVQRDFWPGGAWPMLSEEAAGNVVRLFEVANELGIRQGGIVCSHQGGRETTAGGPLHCVRGTVGAERIPWCTSVQTRRTSNEAVSENDEAATLERPGAFYVDSGCAEAPDGTPARRRVVARLTAGILDAVVFGAGVEYGIDQAVEALLRRRIRTHVPMDAAGTGDPVIAQQVIGRWKRRSVDGTTTAMICRLLGRF